MTPDQFRANTEFTAHLREVLNDPIVQQAIVLAKDGNPPVDAPLSSPEIYSVRVLSQMAGWNGAISFILGLSEPAIPEAPETPPDWGAETEPSTI